MKFLYTFSSRAAAAFSGFRSLGNVVAAATLGLTLTHCAHSQDGIIRVIPSGATFNSLTQANLQAAVNKAVCGDEVQIQAGAVITLDSSLILNKNCDPGKEITITTTKKEWLPDPDMRITPSYAPLIPILQLNLSRNKGYIPIFRVDQAAGPARGIKIIGIGLRAGSTATGRNTVAWPFLWLGNHSVCDPASHPASNLTVDRVYMSGLFEKSGEMTSAVFAAGDDVRIINSFFDDFHSTYTDLAGILINNGGKGYVIRNNYFGSGMPEAVMLGAGGPPCQKGKAVPTGILIEHNHSYKSLRWYPGSPYYSGVTPIMKNHFECKNCDGLTIRWNTGENSWGQGGGQWHAVAITTRIAPGGAGPSGGEHPDSARASNPIRATLDATRTQITLSCPSSPCDYVYPPVWEAGGGIALATVTDPRTVYEGWENRRITTISDQFHFTVDPPFSNRTFSSNVRWNRIELWNRASNIVVRGNYWKNTAQDLLLAPRDTVLGGGGSGNNIQYANNLTVNSSPYFLNCCGMSLSALNFAYLGSFTGYGPTGVSIINNTRYATSQAATSVTDPAKYLTRDDAGRLIGNSNVQFTGDNTDRWVNLTIANNLFGQTMYGGPQKNSINARTTNSAGTVILNNSYNGNPAELRDYYAPCDGSRRCGGPTSLYGGRFNPQFRDEAGNDFSVKPSSIYSKAGTDGKDIGVNMDDVAAIRQLTVIPAADHLLFSWTLPPFMSKLGCSLEVTPNANLINDGGNYQVVNALRPDFFQRSDSDRSNTRAKAVDNGVHRQFQVGDSATATGDDGKAHDLALNPNTAYYYRLQCGGAVERGTARTKALSGR